MKTLNFRHNKVVALLTATMLMLCAVLGAKTTAYAASDLYNVTGDYAGSSFIIPAGGRVLTQDEIKANLYVRVRIFTESGDRSSIDLTTGRGRDGSLKMSQVSVFKSKDWNTYASGTRAITQEGALSAFPTVEINDEDFGAVSGMGLANKISQQLTAAVFDVNGNLYGTFGFAVLCELENNTETVINGLDFETIVTRVNALAEKVSALEGVDPTVVANVNEALNSIKYSDSTIDTADVSSAINSIDLKIAAIEDEIAAMDPSQTAAIAAKEADIAKLSETKSALIDLQRAFRELAEHDNTVKEQLKSLIEEYNDLYAELTYLRTDSGSSNAGYAGVQNGRPVVYINGTGFAYDQSSGQEIQYVDSNAQTHSVVKYHANDHGVSFDFFITLGGVHVINADGSTTVYEDTLSETLIKVDAILNGVSTELTAKKTALDAFYTDMQNVMGKEYVGTTDEEKLAEIKTYVQQILSNYGTMKGNYVALVKALKGDLTEEEIMALSKTDVESEIKALQDDTKRVQDAIQKALTGKDVTDANRQSLEELLLNVKTMSDNLVTTRAELQALIDATGKKDAASALEEVKKIIREIQKLEAENKALTDSNASLKKAVEDAKKSSSPSNKSSALKTLQDKIKQLTDANSTLKKQLQEATTAANNAATAAKNQSSSGNTSNSTTIKALQDKINDLTSQLAKAKSSNSTSSTTTTKNKKTDTETDKKTEDVQKADVVQEAGDKDKQSVQPAPIESPAQEPLDGELKLDDPDNDDETPVVEPLPEDPATSKGLPAKAIIFLAILLLLLLGGGGFFVYKMFFAKPKTPVNLDDLMDDEFDDEEGFDTDAEAEPEVDMADEVEIDDSDDYEEEFAV
ncbi:MAG: hypothetical protein K6G10_02730 [Butyrivibrio sp.]|nr:hypothetical protein [Butyrivibrio sp.]